MRFIGFDSFQEIPSLSGPDADRPYFPEGTYSAGEEDAYRTLSDTDGPLSASVRTIDFYGYWTDGTRIQVIIENNWMLSVSDFWKVYGRKQRT